MSARVRNPIQPGDGDPRHGTSGGYGNHGCRCEECTRAWADLVRLLSRALSDLRRRHPADFRSILAELQRAELGIRAVTHTATYEVTMHDGRRAYSGRCFCGWTGERRRDPNHATANAQVHVLTARLQYAAALAVAAVCGAVIATAMALRGDR